MLQVFQLLRIYLFALFMKGLVHSTLELGQTEDVIGQYNVANEKQCQRLCWYHRLCASYSYHRLALTVRPAVSTSLSKANNCVLHTKEAVQRDSYTSKNVANWIQRSASIPHVTHNCNTRPCHESEVCVPASSASSHMTSKSHVCLWVTAYCGDPAPVVDGDVTVWGRRRGDVAFVTCRDMYAASPENVSMELVCLATSQWSNFNGECLRYEFHLNKEGNFRRALPWNLRPASETCVKGLFVEAGAFHFHLRPDMEHNVSDINFRISFRYQHGEQNTTEVVWTARKNDTWHPKTYLGPMPLVPGDSFNLTLHVHSDRLQLVLNEVHVYNVPLLGVNGSTDGVNLSDASVLGVGGSVNVTFVNLLKKC